MEKELYYFSVCLFVCTLDQYDAVMYLRPRVTSREACIHLRTYAYGMHVVCLDK
ncbi:hypothetical protein E2C01_033718 [Portunus trituberculatus]|uniref:Uncharacterized protein n=1 Tax=Portunus trituberculatus TaxID=210409 RepID=A0A5B7F4X3_PORTR|nr:hypothetical protein [Portunus trituberculatus]